MEATPQAESVQGAHQVKRSGIDTCWHVPALGALAFLVASTGDENSGFFYVALMDEFDTDRSRGSWPTTVISIMLHLAGMFQSAQTPNLSDYRRWFSIYQITHIGGVLTWIGMMASTFAPTLPWMVITFGLIYG
ncbi:unnamed protein product, partial [Ixodes persulcatus]